MSDISSVHVDQALTDFAVQLPLPEEFVADIIAPVVPVKKESDKFYKFYREELKLRNTKRADGAEANELVMSQTTDTYSCEEYALKAKLTDRVRDNADSVIRPAQRRVEKVMYALRLDRENRVKTMVEDTSNWGGNTTPSTKWDAASADIEDDIKAAREAFLLNLGVYPNVAVINGEVHATIIQWLRAQPAGITLAEYRSLDKFPIRGSVSVNLAGLFGIPKWVVAGAVYDSADFSKVGESNESLARLWADNCSLFFINPRPSLESVSAMYTFRSRDWLVKSWRDDAIDSTWYQVSYVCDEKIPSSAAGYILTDVLT